MVVILLIVRIFAALNSQASTPVQYVVYINYSLHRGDDIWMSKNKRIWYPRCKVTRKIRYPNQVVAEQVLQIFVKTGKPDPGIHHYRCSKCAGFHLGSSTRSLARLMKEANYNDFSTVE